MLATLVWWLGWIGGRGCEVRGGRRANRDDQEAFDFNWDDELDPDDDWEEPADDDEDFPDSDWPDDEFDDERFPDDLPDEPAEPDYSGNGSPHEPWEADDDEDDWD